MDFNIRKKGIDLWNWLFKKSLYITAISTVGLNIVDISNINDKEWVTDQGITIYIGGIFYWLLVVCAFVFGMFSINNANEVDKLEKDNLIKENEINSLEASIEDVVNSNSELFNSYLKLILSNLNFSHTERISVYKIIENNFTLIGRTSINPMLKAIGRSSYPIDEGFIGKGWAEGSYFIDDLPDPMLNKGNDYYDAVNNINQIPKATLKLIKMKSRTYYVCSIDGYDNEPTAVLVIESSNEKAFKEEEIREKIDEIKKPLEMFIEKNLTIKLRKNNNLAENEGF